MNEKAKHGGKRAGAGKKPGTPRTKLQITLPPLVVAKMDAKRGETSRSEWIERKLK